MIRFSRLILIFCTLLSLGANASNADNFSTALGFHRVDSNAPQSLAVAANSVFEVRIPEPVSPSDIRVLDLNSPSLKNIDAKFDAMFGYDRLAKIVLKRQVANCRNQHLQSQCPVTLSIVKATAFLAGGDGSILLTNAHVIDELVRSRKSVSPQASIRELISSGSPLPIFLFDRNGNLVFDPYDSAAKAVAFGVPSPLAKAQGAWFAEDSDYVVIRLSRIIGKQILIGARPSSDQMVWHMGYPACTGCDRNADVEDPALNVSRKENGDSNGIGLFYTPSGRVETFAEAKTHLDLVGPYANLLSWENMIFFSGDAQVGMSGGPILNAKGEAVGVWAGAKPLLNGSGKMNVLSRGVRPREFDLP